MFPFELKSVLHLLDGLGNCLKMGCVSSIGLLPLVGTRKRSFAARRGPGGRKRLLYSILWGLVICVLTYHILHFLAEQFDGCKKKSNCYCNYSLQDQSISRCYSIDTDGCPRTKAERYTYTSRRRQHPLSNVEDTTERCHGTLGKWMVEKFPDIDPNSIAGQLLMKSSCLYLLSREVEFANLLTDQINSPKWLESHKVYPGFLEDLKNEIIDSVHNFLSFNWDKHPLFSNTLPDDHPLITSKPDLLTTSERNDWRDEVKSKILSTGRRVVDRPPKLIILGGGGGSGKSSVLTNLRQSGRVAPQDGFVVINPDDIKVMDPVYVAIRQSGDYRAADVVHNESENIAKEIYKSAIAGHTDIIFDGTFSDLNRSIALVQTAKDEGYEVYLIAVTVDALTAVRRSYQRAVISKRLVPSVNLLRAHKLFSANFEAYMSLNLIDYTILFDNNRYNRPPTEIAYKILNDSSSDLVILDKRAYERFRENSLLNEHARDHTELFPNSEQEVFLGRCISSIESQHRYIKLYITLQDPNIEFCICGRSSANVPSYFEVRSLLSQPLSDEAIATKVDINEDLDDAVGGDLKEDSIVMPPPEPEQEVETVGEKDDDEYYQEELGDNQQNFDEVYDIDDEEIELTKESLSIMKSLLKRLKSNLGLAKHFVRHIWYSLASK
eukprot:TRINITY_DN3893_c0_g1_i2.p1 TRINITY_DN3893_c0_g1~~TRINITY_DN3893_c0_g1_i2.p1  ORF type:complete len:665 (+),score=67.09 TRINITY_DN3893_c0_g1_i2:220-2214(+)